MTPEELDKKVEFILEMQAQSEVNIANLTASVARSEVNIDNLRASVARSEVNIDNLRASVARSEVNIDSLRISIAELSVVLTESIKLSDERSTRLDEKLAKLAVAQRTTDERLNALIGVVERHITGPDHVARP